MGPTANGPPDEDEDEAADMRVVHVDIVSPAAMSQIADFVSRFCRNGQHVGNATFVLFSLLYKRRVSVWHHMKEVDGLDTHARRAEPFI